MVFEAPFGRLGWLKEDQALGAAERVYSAVYCDTIMRRWEASTGKRALLPVTDVTVEDLAESRNGIVLDAEAA